MYVKLFLGCSIVNNIFKRNVALENSKCHSLLYFRKWFHFASRSTAKHLAIVSYRIARVLKNSGATDVVALIYQSFFTVSLILVLFTNLDYMALWKGVLS